MSIWTVGISETVALAAVALIGYLFGRRSNSLAPAEQGASEDIVRATSIAVQLESIAAGLRHNLAYHHTQVERFKKELRRAAGEQEEEAWRRLREESEAILTPTLELVGQLSAAYDNIRQQSQALTHYTVSRVDPATGLSNSKALEEQLEIMLSQTVDDSAALCSVAMLSLEGGLGDEKPCIEDLGKAVARQLRGSDFAARFGTDELVVVMPKTSLTGAGVFGRRLRANLEVQLGYLVCSGLAQAQDGESARALLGRADAALYSARADQPGTQYRHTGASIQVDGGSQEANQPASAECEVG